ncbi:MAG: YlbF family regulator [Acholeplasmataceae bacterium]|nr:YlbF family regulator [Acholeplasmataceae bacterium]
MTEKEKLIEMIKNNESIKRYQAIENVLNKNEDLKLKINQLKSIQKQLINAKEVQKQKTIEHFQMLYDQLLEEIQGYPLMSDYLALQGDINDMIQQITQIIEDGINKELNGKL